LHGRYQDQPFELTGRVQFRHEAGGVWNEWYATFPNDRWGCLAEAQGRFYFTFQCRVADPEALESFATLTLGALIFTLSTSAPLTVAEKGIAHTISAEGEIPYRFVPGVEHHYANLSGPHDEFATLDYSEDPPLAFVGREANFAELGFPHAETSSTISQVEAQQLSCPTCGSALSLRAPDYTERVTCPSCGSLLDINQGKLKFLRVLDQKVTPMIPLGSVGRFDRHPPLTVIGFLQRSVEFDSIRYFWEEYLLHAPLMGFRWLVRKNDHWTFARPLPPGKVTTVSQEALYEKKKFKLYQGDTAQIEHILGEFYWRIEIGEMVVTTDYIAPPLMLSHEVATSAQKTEGKSNWSLGEYLTPPKVEKAFNLRNLPRPWRFAPHQPYPHAKVYEYWLQLSLIALCVGFFLFFFGAQRQVVQQTYQLEPIKAGEESVVRFSEPFTLQARQNVEITVTASLDNTWLDIVGDLISQQTDEAQGFSLTLGDYRSVERSEFFWTEGRRSSSVYLSAPEAGIYILGLDINWHNQHSQSTLFTLTVRQGVPRLWHLVLTILALSVVPLFVALRHYYFERQRWSNSIYNPYDSKD